MKKRKRPLRKKKKQSVTNKTPTGDRRAPATFEEISKDLKTTGWGEDKLTQELEEAFCNIGVSFVNLKPHFNLLQKANEIFLDTFDLLSCNTPDTLIACSLFGRSFGCFLGAVRLSCGGQLS